MVSRDMRPAKRRRGIHIDVYHCWHCLVAWWKLHIPLNSIRALSSVEYNCYGLRRIIYNLPASVSNSVRETASVGLGDGVIFTIPVQVHAAAVPDGVSRDPPRLRRVVVAVGTKHVAGLAVGVVPELGAVSERVDVTCGAVAVGVVEIGGDRSSAAVGALRDAAARVEGVVRGRRAGGAREQAGCAEDIQRGDGTGGVVLGDWRNAVVEVERGGGRRLSLNNQYWLI